MSCQGFFVGDAVFVRPSYDLAAVLLVVNALAPHRRERRLLFGLQQQTRNQRQ